MNYKYYGSFVIMNFVVYGMPSVLTPVLKIIHGVNYVIALFQVLIVHKNEIFYNKSEQQSPVFC